MKALLLLTVLFVEFAKADNASPCTYRHLNELELNQVDNCINFQAWLKRPNGSDALIAKQVAITATYDKGSLSYLYSKHGLFYFNRSGTARRTINYDNGPDYFQEGLARTSWREKIGFFDKQLNIIIPPIFDFAFPFKNGYSLVCNGCRKSPDGEYNELVGGYWGVILRSGEIAIPIKFTNSGAVAALNKLKAGP